ncbi:hypothetical protein ACTFIU_002561 [Dictyostelium citrinum]
MSESNNNNNNSNNNNYNIEDENINNNKEQLPTSSNPIHSQSPLAQKQTIESNNNNNTIIYNHSYGSLVDGGGQDNIIIIDKSRSHSQGYTGSVSGHHHYHHNSNGQHHHQHHSSSNTGGLGHARSYSHGGGGVSGGSGNNSGQHSKGSVTARHSYDMSKNKNDCRDDISVSFHDTYSDNQRIHQHPETGLTSIQAKEKLKYLIDNLLDEKEMINPFSTRKVIIKEILKVTPILYIIGALLLVVAYGLRYEYGFQSIYIILDAGLLLIFIILHFYMHIREQKTEHNEIISKARGHLKRYDVFGDTLENGVTTTSDSISLMSVCRDEVWKKLPLSILVEGDLASLREGELVQIPLECIEPDFKDIHFKKGEHYTSDLLFQKLQQLNPKPLDENKQQQQQITTASPETISIPTIQEKKDNNNLEKDEEIQLKVKKLFNSGRCCFLVKETPCFSQIEMSIEANDKHQKLRPTNPVINAINYIYLVIERFLWASVGVSMFANIFRSIFQSDGDLVDLLIIRQVNLMIAFSFVMLPCILLLITYSIGHAKLLALYDVLQERSLKGEISDDHPALNFDTDYNDDKIPDIPFKLMKTYWQAIVSTKHVAFSHSSNLLHSIASTTVICCIDKDGVVSEPVNTVGEVCFLKDDPVRLELSSEYSHTQYSISFNDNQWRDHINALKPLGLDCILNRTCRLYSELPKLLQPPAQSTSTTPGGVPSLPHSGSQIFSQDQASKLQLIRDREESSDSNSQCLCLLAKEIGFSEDVSNQYIRLKEIHTLTQSHHKKSTNPTPSLSSPSLLATDKDKGITETTTTVKVPESTTPSSTVSQEDLVSPYMISLVSKDINSDTLQLLTKGSTDLVIDHCQYYFDGESIRNLGEAEKEKIKQIYTKWGANESLKAICFAYKPIESQFRKLFVSGNVNSPLVDVRFSPSEDDLNNLELINNNSNSNNYNNCQIETNKNINTSPNVNRKNSRSSHNDSLRVQLTSKNINESKLSQSEGIPKIIYPTSTSSEQQQQQQQQSHHGVNHKHSHSLTSPSSTSDVVIVVGSPLPGSCVGSPAPSHNNGSGTPISTSGKIKKKNNRLSKFSSSIANLSTSRFLRPNKSANTSSTNLNQQSPSISPPIQTDSDNEENNNNSIDEEDIKVKKVTIDSEYEEYEDDNNDEEEDDDDDDEEVIIKKVVEPSDDESNKNKPQQHHHNSDKSVDVEEYENENDESDYSSDNNNNSETEEITKDSSFSVSEPSENDNKNKKKKKKLSSSFSPNLYKFKKNKKDKKLKDKKLKDKKSNTTTTTTTSTAPNNNNNKNNNNHSILINSNFDASRNNSFADTSLINKNQLQYGSSLGDSYIGDDYLPSNLEDIDVLEQLQMNQIFIGMAGMKVLPKSHANHFVEVLRAAGIRFVYFSNEDRRTSNSFVNKLGLETDWNCCISLRDPAPNEVIVPDGPSRLPKGISSIRQHLEEVDNVPLLVPMFSDCNKANTKEMIKILQENGEVVCCIGSALNYENTSIFCQSDLAFSLEPAVPRCLNQPLNKSDPLPLLTSRNFFETPTFNSLSGTSKDPSLPIHMIAGTKRVPSEYPSTHSLNCDLTSLPCSLVFHRRTDFNEILKFFHVGRQLLTNTRQCLLFILSASMSLVLMTLVGGILALSLNRDGVIGQVPLTGLQLMWLEFLIIPLLGYSLLATPEDQDVMKTLSPKNNSEFEHIPTFAQYIAIRLVPSILLTAFFFLWSLHSLTGASWSNIFGADLSEWSSNVGNHGVSFSSALLVSQNIMMFAFVYYLCVTSISFIHHTQSITKFNPLRNYVWVFVVILCLALQIAFSFISLKVIDGIHLLGKVSFELYIVLFCWAFFVIAIDEFVKGLYKKWFDDLQLELRLEFDTKLGMHSPI